MKQQILLLALISISLCGSVAAEERTAASILALVKGYEDKNDYSRAIKELDKVIKLSPSDASLWMRQSMGYCHLNDYKNALRAADRACELKPKDAHYLQHRANLLSLLGQNGKALPAYKAAAMADPGDMLVGCRYQLAKLTLEKNPNINEAIKSFDEAIKKYPENAELLHWRAEAYARNNDGKGCLRDALKAFSIDHNEAALNGHAEALKAHKQFNPAIELVSYALKSKPQAADLYFMRAALYADLKHFDLALRDMDSAIKIKPNDYHCWLARSHICCSMQDYNNALQNVDRAVSLCPKTDASLLAHKSNILTILNRRKEALSAMAAACKADPKSVYCSCRYAALTLDDEKDMAPAIKTFTAGLRQEPQNSDFMHWRALAFERNNQLESAVNDVCNAFAINHSAGMVAEHFEWMRAHHHNGIALALADKCIKEQPKIPELFVLRSRGRLDAKQISGAQNDLAKAFQLDPKNTDALGLSADLKMEQLDYDGALSDYSRALELKPDHIILLERRALAYKELQQPKECLADLEHLYRLYPQKRRDTVSILAWCYESQNRKKDAERLYREVMSGSDRDQRSGAALNLARLLMNENRTAEAIEVYKQLNKNDPQAHIHARIAKGYSKLMNWQEAVKELTCAIELDSKQTSYYSERAEAYVHLHNYKSAVDDYSVVIQRDRVQTPRFLRARADVYDKWGKVGLANKDRNEASAIIKDVMMNSH